MPERTGASGVNQARRIWMGGEAPRDDPSRHARAAPERRFETSTVSTVRRTRTRGGQPCQSPGARIAWGGFGTVRRTVQRAHDPRNPRGRLVRPRSHPDRRRRLRCRQPLPVAVPRAEQPVGREIGALRVRHAARSATPASASRSSSTSWRWSSCCSTSRSPSSIPGPWPSATCAGSGFIQIVVFFALLLDGLRLHLAQGRARLEPARRVELATAVRLIAPCPNPNSTNSRICRS